MAPRRDDSERSCVVTRQAQPAEGLIRFVRSPDGSVVPDVRGKLPGRGVWVTGRRDMVEEAVRRKLFARGLKSDVTADADLPDLVDRLLLEAALSALSMARKAGLVVTGYGKVSSSIARGAVVVVVHAREAADDGRRKVAQAMRRRARAEAEAVEMDGDDPDWDEDGDWDEAEDTAPERGGAANPDDDRTGSPDLVMPKVIGTLFAGAELDLALGGSNVIHAALLAGGASTSFLNNAAALARYRGAEPDSDWMAGPRMGTAKG